MAKIDLLSLRPSQFALGIREVESKVRKLKKFTKSEREEYLKGHPVPLVLAPNGDYYIIDHHHLVRAAWEAGLDEVVTELKADMKHLSPPKFWQRMEQEGWVYLHDQFGKGPHPAELLPLDVRCMADDPFRSLAWAVREENGFKKVSEPFCEFRWADFFRKHIPGHPVKMGFEHAIKEAHHLCTLPEAKALPGYLGTGKKAD